MIFNIGDAACRIRFVFFPIKTDMLTERDLKQIQQRGIQPSVIEDQVRRFETGFPWLRIESVATVGNGIERLDTEEEKLCITAWKEYKGTIEKFVPASGAASRMFKDLYAFVASDRSLPTTEFERLFFDKIERFAFYPSLNSICVKLTGIGINGLVENGRHKDVVKALLDSDGLNYGSLPKGLLAFHRSPSGAHTPVDEHLEEGAQYAADNQRHVRIHFTVSQEHRAEFKRLLSRRLPVLEKVWGVTYDVTMSEQKPSTDTIAVLSDNSLYRNEDNTLLFRPAGHGALIENLNEREAEIVFIKNIDNVVPASLRHATIRSKKVLAGYLVRIQCQVAQYMTQLEGECSHEQLLDILRFVEQKLHCHYAKAEQMGDKELAEYLRGKLNRPIRVCGMVKNEGEPGGGPYLAYNRDGSYSPQILEAAQINSSDPSSVELMHSGTHFNPVDLVCFIKDYKGTKFNLTQYVDYDTGLISEKSKNGVAIKALELPGLWNGSMSDWNTLFVEVPIETFNPVKTVNDLLRPQHQF